MSARLAVTLCLALSTGAACAMQPAPATSSPIPSDDRQAIHIENAMPATLRVSVLEDGSETPLGRVPAAGEATLRMRGPVTGSVRLVARPSAGLNGRRHVSEPIQIMPGQRVTWRLRFSPGISDVPQLSTFHVVACGGESPCER